MDIVRSKNPWAPETCGQHDCMVCISKNKKSGTTTTCRLESVCYVMSCDVCQENKVSACYWGESARTGYLRGREHLDAHEKRSEESALYKHDQIHHNGEKSTFSMKILRKHSKPLSRQLQEATLIENSKVDIMLNSKGEFNGARVPRVVVEIGSRTLTKEYAGSQPTPNHDLNPNPTNCSPKLVVIPPQHPISPNNTSGNIINVEDEDTELRELNDREKKIKNWEKTTKDNGRKVITSGYDKRKDMTTTTATAPKLKRSRTTTNTPLITAWLEKTTKPTTTPPSSTTRTPSTTPTNSTSSVVDQTGKTGPNTKHSTHNTHHSPHITTSVVDQPAQTDPNTKHYTHNTHQSSQSPHITTGVVDQPAQTDPNIKHNTHNTHHSSHVTTGVVDQPAQTDPNTKHSTHNTHHSSHITTYNKCSPTTTPVNDRIKQHLEPEVKKTEDWQTTQQLSNNVQQESQVSSVTFTSTDIRYRKSNNKTILNGNFNKKTILIGGGVGRMCQQLQMSSTRP